MFTSQRIHFLPAEVSSLCGAGIASDIFGDKILTVCYSELRFFYQDGASHIFPEAW